MKLNTRAKEIKQVDPSEPDNSQSIRPLPSHQLVSLLSRNRYRVWSPTHRRAIKEDSKVAKHDWVDQGSLAIILV